jgi:hypothetical protein
VNLNDLEDAALVRKALDALSLRLDGKQAAVRWQPPPACLRAGGGGFCCS